MNDNDNWASGMAYEPYIGRWSRLVARDFLHWLALPPGRAWLDVGCGTGALAVSILQQAAPAAVTGLDPAPGFIRYALRQVPGASVRFTVGNALALPFASGAFDAAVSGLALNFMPDPEVALAEMARVARRGAAVAVYVWDYAGQMEMLRIFWDAVVELDPASADKDEGFRFPICRPEPLAQLFRRAGLVRVSVEAIDVATRFRDFDDYWQPFLGGQGPAPGYVAMLPEARRVALREHIRSRLPAAPDGAISLTARAWAVRGGKP